MPTKQALQVEALATVTVLAACIYREQIAGAAAAIRLAALGIGAINIEPWLKPRPRYPHGGLVATGRSLGINVAIAF